MARSAAPGPRPRRGGGRGRRSAVRGPSSRAHRCSSARPGHDGASPACALSAGDARGHGAPGAAAGDSGSMRPGSGVSRRAGHVAAFREPPGLTDASDVWRRVAPCPGHPLDARPLCPAHSGRGLSADRPAELPGSLPGPRRSLSASAVAVVPQPCGGGGACPAPPPPPASPAASPGVSRPGERRGGGGLPGACSSALAAQPSQLSPCSAHPCSSALVAPALAAQPLQLSPCSARTCSSALAAQPLQLSPCSAHPCSSALAAQPLQRPPCDLGTPGGPGAERAFRGPGHAGCVPSPRSGPSLRDLPSVPPRPRIPSAGPALLPLLWVRWSGA
ncbi:translation initiation factor IF-2-like [Canis lupus dingo]|uniref:translation initiation factor IF-2-like n=1 Tax=Canis lupus dingo TaxID=286419 RepID=UPI0020C474DC|nr:translation initiation factor IF-2-like [Canis lupus dingo]